MFLFPLVLALSACAAAGAIAADIAKEAPLVCPEFSFIPAGAQVCSGLAGAVQSFLELWATTHPTSATAGIVAAAKARRAVGAPPVAADLAPLERVGNIGNFPKAIAAELTQTEMGAALVAYLKLHSHGVAADAGAPVLDAGH